MIKNIKINKIVENSSSDKESDDVCAIIEDMFSSRGYEAYANSDELDITVYVYLKKEETLSGMISIFDIAKKLVESVLPQYQSEMELFQSKFDEHIISFEFTFNDADNESYGGSDVPF